ncbi:hypothetical protein MLD38_034472 [Melastoma candidum]|uniref:Uncharacterized protein n=1 Tax=Melastoma candidum TaxID=119954 RepID=A0ACB9MCC7_9MYRT|nr:hypothetical protein MLD38_034472 [Melastoma candidum]
MRYDEEEKWGWRLVLLLLLTTAATSTTDTTSAASGIGPFSSDATYILLFKSKADPHDLLPFSSDGTSRVCRWPGVQCIGSRINRLVIQDLPLSGTFPSGTLACLDQLRVLSLQNDSLSGPIPDLSSLSNLKSLFLDHNSFSGSFPPSVLYLHRIRILDLSSNNLTGPLPLRITDLDKICYLRLDSNQFNGSLPPLNQSSLLTFNVSGNDLVGPVPVTPVLSRFGLSSYVRNPGLCGRMLNKECDSRSPFFGPSPTAGAPELPVMLPPTVPLGENEEVQGGLSIMRADSQPSHNRHERMALIGAFSSGAFVFIFSLLCLVLALKKRRHDNGLDQAEDAVEIAAAAAAVRAEQESELEAKVKQAQIGNIGNLVFCAGEVPVYTLEQLMHSSAEMLGRGTVGTTYKAVMDIRIIVIVKRLDSGKFRPTVDFERQMEAIGGLRHPNLVPLRAYFQAKLERLLIYDYHLNGSLHSLLHGSKSARPRLLHWTSCLKIAEDVAQGLSYIHHACRLIHGNLKSTNVLFGHDFEACISDYCLSGVLINHSPNNDHDLVAYKAPELRNNAPPQATSKSDVYAYGVLLLELLTSQLPSQQPESSPEDTVCWAWSTREDNGPEERLGMMLEVALACRRKSPEQRPEMWEVLKMLQDIKDVAVDDVEVVDA